MDEACHKIFIPFKDFLSSLMIILYVKSERNFATIAGCECSNKDINKEHVTCSSMHHLDRPRTGHKACAITNMVRNKHTKQVQAATSRHLIINTIRQTLKK